jgi:hypothetical protein
MSNESYNFNDIGDHELASMLEELADFHTDETEILTHKDIALIRKGAERLRRATDRHRSLSAMVFNNPTNKA